MSSSSLSPDPFSHLENGRELSGADPRASAMPAMSDLFPSWAEREEEALPAASLRGRTVLVTGAGGSLGRALAYRLAALPVRRLVLVDTSEHGLIQLREGLRSAVATDSPDVEYVLGDLRLAPDRARCLDAAPAIVLHAAAYKHVPFLEDRPIAAAQNNLLATADWLADCGAHAAVDRFVLVSTDKAVAPVGVMGATKAAAERLLRAVQETEAPGLTPTTVRLCNVFGSRGSVVPRFFRCLQTGDPLPVTHPDMERWFTSPEAAARGVLQALRHEGGTYVPAACESINILGLARRMVRWARPEADPENWIRHVGLRPGERLQEDLMAPSERPATSVKGGLMRTRADSRPSVGTMRAAVDRVRQRCAEGASEAVRVALLHAAAADAEGARRAVR